VTPPAPVVFLLDVDNTLLDNDRIIADLKQHLAQAFGTDTPALRAERTDRYWAIFQKRRAELGYADYLGALQRYRAENPHDPNFLQISSFLLDYPFADRLFPGTLAVIERLRTWGPTAILSDGDVVFPPRKIQRSGLSEAVDDPETLACYPPADVTIECVGDLLRYDLPALCDAVPAGPTTAASGSTVGERP
jgi:FMN phosphatase YigB (HAD superfamily)